MSESMLLELRNAAKVERDRLLKYNLKTTADALETAIKTFAALPTAEHLATLNGLWARGVRHLGFASGPAGGNGCGAGLKDGAKLTEAA